MRIYVDVTEPGVIFHQLSHRAGLAGIQVERTLLHKREGLGPAGNERHPLYGAGADFVICDAAGTPLAGIERKTLDDLAKSSTVVDRRAAEGTKIFRQLHDLLAAPMPILLLEGQPSVIYRRIEPVVLGLQLWCAREGISIVYSTGPYASAHAVVLLARKLAQEAHAIAVEEYVQTIRLRSLSENAAPDRLQDRKPTSGEAASGWASAESGEAASQTNTEATSNKDRNR